MTVILETKRLILRELVPDDAPFILELQSDPDWIRFIGDRGVHDLESARHYIQTGPMAMYNQLGFGLWLMQTTPDHHPIGICGILKRDALPDPDLGFATLPSFRRKGFTQEAARACLDHGYATLSLRRILAVTHPKNGASEGLLRGLGFHLQGTMEDGSQLYEHQGVG